MHCLRFLLVMLAFALVLPADAAIAQPAYGGQPPPGTGPAAPGESWAVLIGINRYQHPRVPKLRYAVNDALALEQTLRAQGFRPDRIVTLTDDKATKAAIEQLLGDELRQKLGPNDRLLVFFAGHGKTDQLRSGEEEGYLIPVDGDPTRLFSTAISMTALRQISDRLSAKHILYIVDSCYSGYAIFNRSIAEDLLEEMTKKPAIQILTAGRQQDEAQERAGHGVFTEVLIRGLSGDAFPREKGWLALEELGLWVKQRVFVESNKKQLPQYGNLSGEGQFVFFQEARAPAGSPPPSPPAAPPAAAGRAGTGSETASLPPAVSPHQSSKIPTIGYLAQFSGAAGPPSATLAAFLSGLRTLGYVEGKTIAIEYRYAEGRNDRLHGLASELVRLNVDIIVTETGQAAVDAKNATRAIPIVMQTSGDAVIQGLAATLDRPGGNVTGLTALTSATSGKRLQLLTQVVPNLSRVGVFRAGGPADDRQWEETVAAAVPLKIELIPFRIKGSADFKTALEDAARQNLQAVLLFDMGGVLTTPVATQLAALAVQHRVPTMGPQVALIPQGILIGYGAPSNPRRAANYVDRILKGANPADLPVEPPTKLALVVNLKTAKAIGLTIPPSILSQADRVIE